MKTHPTSDEKDFLSDDFSSNLLYMACSHPTRTSSCQRNKFLSDANELLSDAFSYKMVDMARSHAMW